MGNVDETWAMVYPPLQELKANQDKPWTERRGEFLDKLGLSDPAQDPTVDAFLRNLDELSDEQRDSVLRTQDADTMLYNLITQQQSAAEPQPESAGYDEAVWADHLATCGPYWDGTEQTWAQFRTWFAYEAEQAGVGEPAVALLDYLETQDIDGRIATFGRQGVTTRKRKREDPPANEKTGTGKVVDEDKEPEQKKRRSARIATKTASTAEQRTGPPTVSIRSAREGVGTQKLDKAQNIGFHMIATLTNPPGAVDDTFAFRQYVRDEYRKESDTQDLTDFGKDGPFAPPYQDANGDEDVNVNIDGTTIVFDDHPGFSTTQRIAVDDWLHSYTVEFYWTVTRIADGAVWQSPSIVKHSVVSEYDDGEDAEVVYTVGADENWTVTFGDQEDTD